MARRPVLAICALLTLASCGDDGDGAAPTTSTTSARQRLAAFCVAHGALARIEAQLYEAPPEDSAEADGLAGRVRRDVGRLVELAPPDIADDVRAYREVTETILDEYVASNYSPGVLLDVEHWIIADDVDRFRAAQRRREGFAERNCDRRGG